MKKTKSLVLLLMLIVIVVQAIAVLCACGDSADKGTKVGTAEEFLNSNGVISLTNDIDLNNAKIGEYDFNGIYINGNGHTVSNANVEIDTTGRIFAGANNVTLDNFNVEVKRASSFGFFGGEIRASSESKGFLGLEGTRYYYDYTMSDVHIKNSKVIINGHGDSYHDIQIGLFFGRVSDGTTNSSNTTTGVPETGSEFRIKNCSVENVELEVTGKAASSVWSDQPPIYVGAFVGKGAFVKLDNCHVKNCDIRATAGGLYDYVRLGGLMGYVQKESNISNCSVENSNITAVGNHYISSVASFIATYSTCVTRVGGLFGSSMAGSEISCSYSSGNTVTSTSTGVAHIGGLGGYAACAVRECYSVNNKIISNGRKADDCNSCVINVGGLVGCAEKSVRSSFALNNEIDVKLKDTNAQYDYFSLNKNEDLREFLDEFYYQYTNFGREDADIYVGNIKKNYLCDESTLDDFVNNVYEKYSPTDKNSLKNHIDTTYTNIVALRKLCDEVYVGALVGNVKEGVAHSACAAGATVTGCHYDGLCQGKLSDAYDGSNCYAIKDDKALSVNSCNKVDAISDFYGRSLQDKLALTDEKWQFSDNGLPVLAFT